MSVSDGPAGIPAHAAPDGLMDVRILECAAGAAQAAGLTVVIDVFRAFSLECELFSRGARRIWPVGALEEAFALRAEHPDAVLFGERGGARVEGCDYGNSPTQLGSADFYGKDVIHTTSAGTQGIVLAVGADEIITGSLVNASACAAYIRARMSRTVSLVAMGNAGITPTGEDRLCAEYIRWLLAGGTHEKDAPRTGFPMAERIEAMRTGAGAHFFDPGRQEIYPEGDFAFCTQADRFPFVIRVARGADGRLVSLPYLPDGTPWRPSAG